MGALREALEEQITRAAKRLAAGSGDALPSAVKKGALIGGGIIAAGTVADILTGAQDKSRTRKQQNIQRSNAVKRQKDYKSFDPNMYADLEKLNGLSQQLYENRSGHSNTWGGNKY